MKRAAALLTIFVFAPPVAFAEQTQFLSGTGLKDALVGNTMYVHYPGCTEAEANLILYFADDGEIHAKQRACQLPTDRATSLRGKWGMEGPEFCVREMGEVQRHCLTLVKVGENTYKRIDTTGLRTDWSMAMLQEGNPEGF